MKQDEVIQLTNNITTEDDVEAIVRNIGVRGLDFEAAKELGVFQRMSHLLCAFHSCIQAAYRIYGGVMYTMEEIRCRKNEIAKACNDFERAYDHFISFWAKYYAHDGAGVEMNEEAERLFHQIMRWMQLPESWAVGDAQHTKDDTDVAIRFHDDDSDKTLVFKKSVAEENINSVDESWCVTRFDGRTHEQTCIEENMDKSSAMMVARRMSADETDVMFTASQVQKVNKDETIVSPTKVFKNDKVIGDVTKIFK